MARVSVQDDTLVVELEGLDRLWALKSRLSIPLEHVRGATHDPGAAAEPKGLRAPGLHVPKVATLGTYRRDGERTFWDVTDGRDAVVVQLADTEYDRLVVEVDDPRATVDTINAALARRG